MALPLTKLGRDVFAPVTAGGAARGADMGDAAVLTTEYEKLFEALAAGAGGITLTDDVIYAINSGAGTANAVQATATGSMSTAPGAQLITINFTADNTGPMTISINGEAPRPLVTNPSAAIEAGYIRNGMSALIQIDSAGNYRLFSYGDADAVQAAAEAAMALAESWAEGTLPGGTGTKSSKEWALVAQGAVTYNRISVRGTTTGVGPYDVGVSIGSANNIDIKIGGVIQDHDLYTVSGTEFTMLSDPGSGLAWEAVVQSEVRELGAPSDGTVTKDALAPGAVTAAAMAPGAVTKDALAPGATNAIITADMYGAVFDGSADDQAKIKAAALAAAAAGVPFVVPNKGFTWDEGLVLQVPEDFATIQEAHNATLNWIFPAYPPKFAATTQNHIFPVALTISVAAGDHVHNGVNITWNHPHGELIRLKGRGKSTLTFDSQQAITFASGTHVVRLRFSTWPAVDPQVGDVLQLMVLTGSGAYQNFEGGWRITAVNPTNKDITFAAYARTDTSALTSIISGGIFIHHPTILRFTNMPSSGADVGGIDVHTTLRISDVALMGHTSDAASTNGVVGRAGANVLFDQHCAVLEFPRSGLWLLNGANAQIGYCSFCGNDSGVNNLQSVIDGSRAAIQGNASYNYIGGIGSAASIVQSAFGGAGQAGILINGNASFIGSGHSRRSDLGVDVQPGGFANINDMNVRANVTYDVRRRGGGRIMLTSNDAGTFDPAIDTGDSYGGFTALSATLLAVT